MLILASKYKRFLVKICRYAFVLQIRPTATFRFSFKRSLIREYKKGKAKFGSLLLGMEPRDTRSS